MKLNFEHKIDFETPEKQGDVFVVREQLYPESRGHKVHRFKSWLEAKVFWDLQK